MRDWSSLAPDLIRHVGDLLLATSDVDGYMDMRAVCRGWRSAVADPRSYGAADLRFCPRQWVMLDDDDDKDDEGRLFVNVSTGRFFRRRLPVLRGHALVGASDGLLVLAEIRANYACRVLNHLTGHMLRFAAEIWIGGDSRLVAVAAGSEPLVLLATTGDVYSRPPSYTRRAWFAGPASEQFYGRPLDSTHHIASTVAYAGKIYLAYTDGSVFRRVGSAGLSAWHVQKEPIIAASKPADQTENVFLVESAGELLLVLRQRRIFRVFKVDVERKALEPAMSIGRRALFLGRRCLSVAADKFLTMEGDCLYYAMHSSGRLSPNAEDMHEFKMKKGGRESLVSSKTDQMSGSAHRPLSIAMVFLTYCLNLPDLRAQIFQARRARKGSVHPDSRG